MQMVTRRFVILASVVVLAAGSAGCSGDSASVLAPSATGESEARPGTATGGSSSLSLVMVSDVNGDGPSWGDRVTFNVSQTATTEPHVDLKCTQNGTLVLGATTGFYPSYPWPWTQVMTLSSPSWTGGAASCTATLYYFAGRTTPTLATLHFDAN